MENFAIKLRGGNDVRHKNWKGKNTKDMDYNNSSRRFRPLGKCKCKCIVSLWMVVPRGKFDSTNQKHHPDLGSEASSVEFLRSFLRCHFARKPVEASQNVGCFLRLTTVIRSLLFYHVFLGLLKC